MNLRKKGKINQDSSENTIPEKAVMYYLGLHEKANQLRFRFVHKLPPNPHQVTHLLKSTTIGRSQKHDKERGPEVKRPV